MYKTETISYKSVCLHMHKCV